MLSLMYHHVNSDKYSNDQDILRRHFQYISENFQTVFPGEKINSRSLCLVFDDAYFDFYVFIYPLLKEFNLKAILGVPTFYIANDSLLSVDIRLGLNHSKIMEGDNHKLYTPFCTWAEIKEMISSGVVMVASHSHSHVNLTEVANDEIEVELSLSKKLLLENLGVESKLFIYPYGSFDDRVLCIARKYYDYSFGIGDYIISSWNSFNGVIYRISADNMHKFDFFNSPILRIKRVLNTIKFKFILSFRD